MDGVFDRVQMDEADPAHEYGHQAAILVAEEVLDERGAGQSVANSRISRLAPGAITPGHWRATSMASSIVLAERIM